MGRSMLYPNSGPKNFHENICLLVISASSKKVSSPKKFKIAVSKISKFKLRDEVHLRFPGFPHMFSVTLVRIPDPYNRTDTVLAKRRNLNR